MFDENTTKSQLLDAFDRLAGRIELLAGEQRAFVRLFQNVQDFRCLARAANVHEVTIARRLQRIAQRISDNRFVAALAENANSKIIKEKFVHGKSVRQIANETGMSRYKVKKIINMG